MARRIDSRSEPNIEFDPRHRIVGAIILVSLAVVLLPLILDKRSAGLTTTDSVKFASKPSDLVVKQLSVRKTIVHEKSVADKTGHKVAPSNTQTDVKTRIVVKKVLHNKQAGKSPSQPVEPIAESTSSNNIASQSRPVTPPVKSTSKSNSNMARLLLKPHWTVQVGTFSNPGNIRRLGKQLKERGYSVMFKDVNLKQGLAVRVRVGPYRSRASADRAQGKIKKDIGVKGVVVAGP